MIVIIDNGHGKLTPGKRSPDGTHLEYKWARMFAKKLQQQLEQNNISTQLLVPETKDIPLNTRVARANHYTLNTKHTLLISIHNNAAGADGKWHEARGWQVCIANNASQNSKTLATVIAKEIKQMDIKLRVPTPTQHYWQQNLAICRDTKCPAILTENLFMDNKEDLQLLKDPQTIDKLLYAHTNGILKYIKQIEK